MRGMLLLFALSILWACKQENPPDCFKSVGAEKTITRNLQPFESLSISDKVDVYLHQDSSKNFRVMITGGKNILPKIQTEVKNGILYIEDINTCQWVRDLSTRTRLDVYVNDLKKIELNGFSTLNMEKTIRLQDVEINHISSADQKWNFQANELILNHSGVGDVEIEGRAAVYVVTLYFVAGADARKFKTDYAYVYSYSTADAWVQPVKGMGAFIYDAGNVYFVQEPWKQLVFVRQGTGDRIFKVG
jgi:hypothetical protein